MAENLNELSEWKSGSPDLGSHFPSIDRQIADMSPLNYRAIAVGSNTFIEDTTEGDISTFDDYDDSKHWALPDALEVHGFSYHIGGNDRYYNSRTEKYGKINEDNYGAGLRWNVTENSYLSAGCYKNSVEGMSCYLFGGYETSLDKIIPNTRIGVKTGLVSGYDGIVPEKYLIGDKYAPVITPYFAVGDKDDFRIELGYTYTGGENPEPNVNNPELSIEPASGVVTLSTIVPF